VAGTTSRGAAGMEPQPSTEGDYGYDEAHQESAASAAPAGREHVGPSPALGRPDLAEDFSYDQAHDF
jgi:hypothetical protein